LWGLSNLPFIDRAAFIPPASFFLGNIDREVFNEESGTVVLGTGTGSGDVVTVFTPGEASDKKEIIRRQVNFTGIVDMRESGGKLPLAPDHDLRLVTFLEDKQGSLTCPKSPALGQVERSLVNLWTQTKNEVIERENCNSKVTTQVH